MEQTHCWYLLQASHRLASAFKPPQENPPAHHPDGPRFPRSPLSLWAGQRGAPHVLHRRPQPRPSPPASAPAVHPLLWEATRPDGQVTLTSTTACRWPPCSPDPSSALPPPPSTPHGRLLLTAAALCSQLLFQDPGSSTSWRSGACPSPEFGSSVL